MHGLRDENGIIQFCFWEAASYRYYQAQVRNCILGVSGSTQVQETSRLGCQVKVKSDMEGIEIHLPEDQYSKIWSNSYFLQAFSNHQLAAPLVRAWINWDFVYACSRALGKDARARRVRIPFSLGIKHFICNRWNVTNSFPSPALTHCPAAGRAFAVDSRFSSLQHDLNLTIAR